MFERQTEKNIKDKKGFVMKKYSCIHVVGIEHSYNYISNSRYDGCLDEEKSSA
jgi:hypothetical protein